MPVPTSVTTSRPRGAVPVARLHRRVFHLCAGSSFPVALVFAPETPLMITASVLATVAVVGDGLRLRSPTANRLLTRWLRPLMKEKETRAPFASTYMLVATAVVIGTMSQTFGVLALFYLSLGDPAAALVGQRLGVRSIWDKTVEGSVAMLVVCLAIGALLLETGLEVTYPIMVSGAIAATIFEVIPAGTEDNFKVPVAAGISMTIASLF